MLADIPGLIEGAADGHGLGHRFLRHVERTRVLLHLVELSATSRAAIRCTTTTSSTASSSATIPELAQRPQIVALSKIDLTETREALAALRAAFAARGIELHAVSAATGEGVDELLEAVCEARASPDRCRRVTLDRSRGNALQLA